jgi:hypothetical protein
LDHFAMDQCKVTLDSEATLRLQSLSQLWNTEFVKTGKKQTASISVLEGVSEVQHCQFHGGNPALSIADSVQWGLANTTFSDANMGLSALSPPQLFSANSFTGNTTGGMITGADFLLERSVFHNNNVGLVLKGPGKWVQLEFCSFSSNTSAGIQTNQSKLHVFCSDFAHNTVGIQASKGQLKLAKNAGNTFENNTVGVSFQSLERLELQQGHNTFNQQVLYDVTGSFSPSASLSYNGSYHYIYADNTSFSKANSNLLTVGKDTVYLLYASSQPPSVLLCPTKGGRKSEDVSWSRTDSLPEFVAFPNPGNEWVELVFLTTSTKAELAVFNPQGEQVYLEELPIGTYRKQLNIPGSAGLYLVRLIDGDRIAQLRWLKLD